MNGKRKANQLTIFKKYENILPLIHKKDSIIDNCYRDCHNNYFRIFKYRCRSYIKFTSIGKNEVID